MAHPVAEIPIDLMLIDWSVYWLHDNGPCSVTYMAITIYWSRSMTMSVLKCLA